MKKIILYIILLFSLFSFISGGKINEQPILYIDYGIYTYRTNLPHTYTQYRLYVEKDYVSDHENANSYIKKKYKYTIKGISFSKYYGANRNTYMNRFNIYLNNDPYPENAYPLNFYILKIPTILYEIKSNNPHPNIRITWEESYYDARN